MWDLNYSWLLCCLCVELHAVIAVETEGCSEALGMQSGAIPDSSITVSSQFAELVGPQHARIRTESGGGAWCPKRLLSNDSYEYLQIDLGRLTKVTIVEIQGRFGNGQGHEYARSFRLEYQQGDDGEWKRYVTSLDSEILPGNKNTYIAEKRELTPPIICRKIRFVPYSTVPMIACMRVELYGCEMKQHPDPPANLQVVGLTSSQIEIAWQSPPDGSEIIGYALFISDEIHMEFYAVELTPGIERYTIRDLQPKTRYRIEIYSKNLQGRSSGVILQVETKANGRPGPPTNLQVVKAFSTQVEITWQSPSDGSGILGYVLTISDVSQGLYNEVGLPPSANSYTIMHLQPSTRYRVELYSKNLLGRSSGVVIEVETPPAQAHPDPPANLQVVELSATQVEIAWQSPPDGSEIIGYVLTFGGLSQESEFYTVELSPDKERYTIKNLRPKTRYKIEIYSKNLQGHSLRVTLQVETKAKDDCNQALGMESGEIPDEAITASSIFSDLVSPEKGRIRTEVAGGAWCPNPVIRDKTYEYLEIDLGQLTKVTMVEIQGRFGNGQGQEYAKKFRLEYQVRRGGVWHRYKPERGNETLQGNYDTYNTVLRALVPPFTGRRIRFIPYSVIPMTVCMRVELYGCKVTVELPREAEGLRAVVLSDTEIAVTWHPPDDGDVITDYVLTVREIKENSIIRIDLPSDAVKYNLTELKPRSTYSIQLAGKNMRGQGPQAVVQIKTPYRDPCQSKSCPEISTCFNIQIFKAVDWFVPRCVCEDGFSWNDTDQTCVDKDECLIRDICSQICINTVGSYMCECKSGFILGSYGSCRADGDTSWYYFTSQTDIRTLHLESGYEEILVDGTPDTTVLDYDSEQSLIFYSDVGCIQSTYIPQYTEEGVIDTNRSLYTTIPDLIDTGRDAGSPVDVAVDWISDRVYWIDGFNKKIKSASYNGDMIKTVIDDALDEPTHIVLHPEHGYLYLTDCGQTPYIGRISMDGSTRDKVHTYRDGMKGPVGLSIDYVNNRLYWIDAEQHLIGSSNLDGSDYVIVLMDPNIIQHPVSLTVFEDRLSWIEQQDNSILSINRRTGRDVERRKVTTDTALTDLKFYQARMQNIDFQVLYKSVCLEADCEQMCVPSPHISEHSVVTCDCTDGFYLHQDGRSCVQSE